MNNTERKPADWKQPELKVSDPAIVAEADALSSALTTRVNCDTSAQRGADTCQSTLIASPETSQRSRLSSLTSYFLENESQLYWLCASALLTWLGVWFHDTHGMLTWSSGPICFLAFVVSLFAPLAGIPILFFRPNSFERPMLTTFSFVSMLFWNQVPAVSCFALMLFRFKGASRVLGIVVLSALQIGVLCLFPQFFGPRDELDHLQTSGYNLRIYRITTQSEPRCTLTLMEEFALTPLVNFGKIHWRMKDTRSPQSAVILPVDATHVAVLINRFSRYHRTVVDLTVKNLPINVETISGQR